MLTRRGFVARRAARWWRATAGFAGRRGGGNPTRGPGAAGGWAHFHVPFAIRFALGYAFRRGGDVAICNLNEDSRHLTAPERTVECRVSESSVTPTTDFATTYVNISSYSLFHMRPCMYGRAFGVGRVASGARVGVASEFAMECARRVTRLTIRLESHSRLCTHGTRFDYTIVDSRLSRCACKCRRVVRVCCAGARHRACGKRADAPATDAPAIPRAPQARTRGRQDFHPPPSVPRRPHM